MFKKIVINCALIVVTLISFPSYAARNLYPKGCEPKGYEYKDLALIFKPVGPTEKLQTLFLVHNISNYPVKLISQKLRHQAFAPKFKHIIDGQNWAVFVTNSSETHFKCVANNGYDSGAHVDCSQVLQICQYPRAKFAVHNRGTYWLAQTYSMKEAVRSAVKNGILLRW